MSDNYIGGESWVRSSPQYEGEGLFGLAGAFDTGTAAADRLIADANKNLSRLLKPTWGAIDASSLPPDEKNLLKYEPVNFVLQIVGMFENLAAEVIVEANRLSGKQFRTIGIPGINQTTVNMDPNQRDIESIPSQTGRRVVKALRIGMQFMVLVYQAGNFLAVAVANVFRKYAIQGGELLRNYIMQISGQAALQAQQMLAAGQAAVTQVTQQAARVGQNAAQALQQSGQAVLDAAAQAAARAVQTLPPLPRVGFGGFGHLGVAPAAAGPPAAAGSLTLGGLLTGIISTPGFAALIVALITVLVQVGGTTAQAAVQQAADAGRTIPGTERPGPNGETDGFWLNGVWHPKESAGPFGELTVPIGLGVGAIALLYILKK